MQTFVTEAEEHRYAELQQMAFDFARNGETELLVEMIQHGLPVNLADAKGNSLLMLASYNGNLETARALLQAGADADRRNDRGQTPLGGAAFKGYEEIVTLLLENGADIDADNGGGMTPLMFAAMFGRTKAVELLKRQGASLKRRNRIGISARGMVRFSRLFLLAIQPLFPQHASKPLTLISMNNEPHSLITTDAHTGLNLASELAERLHIQLQAANDRVERPGGTNYLLPPPVPKEIIASILFYAICTANRGWTEEVAGEHAPRLPTRR
jgi:hypothetical protein